MIEPGSTTGVATAAVTGMTFSTLFAGTDAGVIIGAFSGAVIYVMSARELSRIKQLSYFIVSFLIGVLAADFTAAILNNGVEHIFPDDVHVSNALGATVAAAVAIRVLMLVMNTSFTDLFSRFMGGRNGNT